MSAALAIFVKTPSLSPVKTRLAAGIGTEKALEFYNFSLKAVEESVKLIAAPPHPALCKVQATSSSTLHIPPLHGGRLGGGADVTAFWAVGEKEGLGDSLWAGLPTLHTGEGDLGQRQSHIYDTLRNGYDKVILIGADAPQLTSDILKAAVTALDSHDFVIGPARDGGYYLFGGRVPLERDIWTAVSWSTDKTRERLEALLPSRPFHLPFLTDVDTKEDLKSMAAEMPDNPTESQKNIHAFIEERTVPG